MTAALLVALALLDGALAGFRASAGTNARIRKGRFNLVAGLRGTVAGAGALAVLGAGLGAALLLAEDPAGLFDELAAAGTRMLAVYLPFAGLVLLSLLAYLVLPVRASSYVILVGLGPFTLVRPLVATGGAVAALWGSGGGVVAVAVVAAVAGVLAVGPVVHRSFYLAPA